MMRYLPPRKGEVFRPEDLLWVMPSLVTAALLAGIEATTANVRPPDVLIGTSYLPKDIDVGRWASASFQARRAMLPPETYMARWHVAPRTFDHDNVYFHWFLRSDDDRALHDHPWPNQSIVLEGEYLEQVPKDLAEPAGERVNLHRRAGMLLYRDAETMHRVQLIEPPGERPRMAKTLFMTGPKEREWGFHCPGGWKHWEAFTGAGGKTVGAGCGELS